jgi:hypothetical protein
MRHALTGRARGKPARFQQQDRATGKPGFIQQRQGNMGGFAGSGRCLKHGGFVCGQRAAQQRQNFVNRELLSDHG